MLTSCSLQTSSAIARSRSGVNTHFFYRMDGKEGDTFNLCTMTEGSILSMSSWLQVNMSRLLLRKVVSAWRTVGLVRFRFWLFGQAWSRQEAPLRDSLRAPSLSGVLLYSWLKGGHPFPSWLCSIRGRQPDFRIALPLHSR